MPDLCHRTLIALYFNVFLLSVRAAAKFHNEPLRAR